MSENKKTLAPGATGCEGLSIKHKTDSSPHDMISASSELDLNLIYQIENRFSGEPELAWRYLLQAGHLSASEPGCYETLVDWLETLTISELAELGRAGE